MNCSLGEKGNWEVVASKHRIAGTQSLTLVPYSADAFTYEPSAQLPVDKQFDIPPDYEHTHPAPVANLSATLSVSTSGEGIIAWIDLSWNPPERNYGGAVVEMKRTTEDVSAYREVGTYKGSSVRISEGVMPNVGFDFRVHALNLTGQIRGLASTTTTNVKIVTVNPPTNLRSTSNIDVIRWQWKNSTSQDIVRHEIEILTAKLGGSRVTVQSFYKGDNPIFNLTANAGVTRYARVRAIHASGTASDWTALVAGIAGSVPEVEIPETVITEARAGLDTTNNLNNLKDGTIYNYPSSATGAPNRVPGMIMTFAGANRQFATQFWDGKTYYRGKEKNDKNQWRPWEYQTGIARGAITSTEIQDGSISTPKLNSNSVTADKISTGAVTALQIKAGAVTSSKIGANQVLAEHIQADAITASHMSSGSIDLGSATVKGTLRAGNIDSNVRNAALLFSANILSNRFVYYRSDRKERFNAPFIERSTWRRITLKAPWKRGSNFTARFDSLLICVAFFSSGNVYIGSIEVPTNSILNYNSYDRWNIKIGESYKKEWVGTGKDKTLVTSWYDITKQLVYVPASTAENAEFDLAIAANPSLDWSIYMQRVRLDSDSKEGVILQMIGLKSP